MEPQRFSRLYDMPVCVETEDFNCSRGLGDGGKMPRIEPLPQQDFRAVYESTFLPLSFVNNYFRLTPFCYSDFSNMHAVEYLK